ncbi:MAG TPA: nucleotidyltransferase domain-containing protein [Synergistaceae bacterium]|nr:nucleotidyltransferase domain-containing protein [Synergistaceae bacterium]HPJ26092.1 nucleotidyltransferase domain-containing protein [Synergistaceae bacterium]HPQ36021.1 nucleotidyltransferase domain-containing protein [Synergistaceae bacterium]
MSVRIEIPREALDTFCRSWKITELALFGSVLREDFEERSDIDILVTFALDATPSLFDMVTMEDELKHIFGRSVDLVSRRGLENSRNSIRRQAILESVEVVYAA